jgi:ubiquinone/menaquinone biosynthesis C-methylase UbiE
LSKLNEVQDYWDSHHLGTQFLESDQHAPGTKEYFVEFDNSMERWEYKNRLMDWLAQKYPNGKSLEVGCGLGQDLTKFAQRGFRVTGLDLAKSVAQMAALHLEAYGLSGNVLQGNAQELAFPDNTFDVVYSMGVLQHTPDIQQAINEILRVLKPGGMAVVVVYHRYSWFNLLSKIASVNVEFEDGDPPIINTYSRRELHRFFSGYSDAEVDLEYLYPKPTPRKGFLPFFYNQVFVNGIRIVPQFIMRNFGWHAVAKAVK